MKEHIAPDGHRIMAKSVELDAERVRRIAKRIVAGLLWYHGHAVPDRSTVRFAVEMGPRVDGQPGAKEAADKVIGDAPLCQVAGGVFRYKYRILAADPALSNWFLEFYGAMHFFVSVLR